MVLFRALVPTVIPLLFAITAVLGAFLLLFLAARLTHFNTITEILVPMIGLGVGIAYPLFIVTRSRPFLHDVPAPHAPAADGGAAGRARRRRGRAEGPDAAPRLRPPLGGVRARVHRADPRGRRHAIRPRSRRQAGDGPEVGARALAGRQADLQREDEREGVGGD